LLARARRGEKYSVAGTFGGSFIRLPRIRFRSLALQSPRDADRTPLPVLRSTISCGASRKKNAPPQNMIAQ
jgi:hypothetical protein